MISISLYVLSIWHITVSILCITSLLTASLSFLNICTIVTLKSFLSCVWITCQMSWVLFACFRPGVAGSRWGWRVGPGIFYMLTQGICQPHPSSCSRNYYCYLLMCLATGWIRTLSFPSLSTVWRPPAAPQAAHLWPCHNPPRMTVALAVSFLTFPFPDHTQLTKLITSWLPYCLELGPGAKTTPQIGPIY